MIGHINAQIGVAMGVINENGEMFVDFCVDNNLVIGPVYSNIRQSIKLLGYTRTIDTQTR